MVVFMTILNALIGGIFSFLLGIEFIPIITILVIGQVIGYLVCYLQRYDVQ